MIVVADTSPINYLVQVGEIDLLSTLFGTVFIPTAVLRELQHPGSKSSVRQWANALPD